MRSFAFDSQDVEASIIAEVEDLLIESVSSNSSKINSQIFDLTNNFLDADQEDTFIDHTLNFVQKMNNLICDSEQIVLTTIVKRINELLNKLIQVDENFQDSSSISSLIFL